jgi:hypothetical protein
MRGKYILKRNEIVKLENKNEIYWCLELSLKVSRDNHTIEIAFGIVTGTVR